jgi:hypothetical protein
VGASEGRGLSVLLVTDSKGSLWAYQVPEPFAHHACHLLPLPAQLDLAVTPRAFLPTVQHVETPQGACVFEIESLKHRPDDHDGDTDADDVHACEHTDSNRPSIPYAEVSLKQLKQLLNSKRSTAPRTAHPHYALHINPS